MDSKVFNYKHITLEDKVIDIKNNLKMKDAPSLNLWHTIWMPKIEIEGINRLIDDINKIYKVFYVTYSEEENNLDLKNILYYFFLEEKKMPLIW